MRHGADHGTAFGPSATLGERLLDFAAFCRANGINCHCRDSTPLLADLGPHSLHRPAPLLGGTLCDPPLSTHPNFDVETTGPTGRMFPLDTLARNPNGGRAWRALIPIDGATVENCPFLAGAVHMTSDAWIADGTAMEQDAKDLRDRPGRKVIAGLRFRQPWVPQGDHLIADWVQPRCGEGAKPLSVVMVLHLHSKQSRCLGQWCTDPIVFPLPGARVTPDTAKLGKTNPKGNHWVPDWKEGQWPVGAAAPANVHIQFLGAPGTGDLYHLQPGMAIADNNVTCFLCRICSGDDEREYRAKVRKREAEWERRQQEGEED